MFTNGTRNTVKRTIKRSFHSTANTNELNRAVIVSVARTPIGSFNGKLSSFEAPKLGALAIRSAVEQAGLSKSEVQEVIMGNVCQANLGQAPARQAAIHAGLSESTICTTVNKMCASGMKSVMYAAQNVMLGVHNTVVAGGFESMSNVPYYLPRVRQGLKLGDSQVVDGLMKDGLSDAYNEKAMGWCAEQSAKAYKFSREDQDAYAITSYKRAAEASEKGYFKNEIISVSVQDRRNSFVVDHDEEFSNINFEKIPTLRAAFEKDGTVTAANSSTISDGGAALVIMSEEKAKRAGLKPLALIRGFADAERAPVEFTVAPSDALPKAFKAAGVSKGDIDFFELNEAFAVVSLINSKILDLDLDKVNIYGGAVALGHPIGCSGARIIITLLSALRNNNKSLGAAAICNGGGGASALVIERLE